MLRMAWQNLHRENCLLFPESTGPGDVITKGEGALPELSWAVRILADVAMEYAS